MKKQYQLQLDYGREGRYLLGWIEADLNFVDGTFDLEGNQKGVVEADLHNITAVVQRYAGKVCLVVKSFQTGITSTDVLVNDIFNLNVLARSKGLESRLKELVVGGIIVDDSGPSINLDMAKEYYNHSLVDWVEDLKTDFNAIGMKYIIL